jgi:hemerythrin
MTYLKWDDTLSVNIEHFDYQHKTLIKLINEFYHEVDKSKTEKLVSVLIGLKKYAEEHFRDEEKYMSELNYSEYLAHKKQHDLFIMKTDEFKNSFINGGIFLPLRIKLFLKRWVVKHILCMDKKYAEFLFENHDK